uniref:Uncharacterized protein n=1 Tax=Romanomermis culicivorax TaxID=13658 RepID=A0A915JSU8_ROMCU
MKLYLLSTIWKHFKKNRTPRNTQMTSVLHSSMESPLTPDLPNADSIISAMIYSTKGPAILYRDVPPGAAFSVHTNKQHCAVRRGKNFTTCNPIKRDDSERPLESMHLKESSIDLSMSQPKNLTCPTRNKARPATAVCIACTKSTVGDTCCRKL